MDERLKFIARLLQGEKMAPLCREYGISRKTGYKIYERYKECGLEGLTDRSRRPYRYANRLPYQIERAILNLKNEYPHWGAVKIRAKLKKLYSDIQLPAKNTIHAVLDRHDLVSPRKRRRHKAKGTCLSNAKSSNELWCADYIRTDNRIPFSCANALFGLSRLSVWWLRLGIDIGRIKPGHPQQNGRHEVLPMSPGGTKMSYRCQSARGKNITLGDVNVLKVAEARDEARIMLWNSARGIHPAQVCKEINITKILEKITLTS